MIADKSLKYDKIKYQIFHIVSIYAGGYLDLMSILLYVMTWHRTGWGVHFDNRLAKPTSGLVYA